MVRSLRFCASMKWSMLVTAGETLNMMNTSAPRLKIFSATYPLMPLTNVTTAITAATPMTTPSKVSAERSLFAHNDRNAILIASEMFMKSGLRPQVFGLRLQGVDFSPRSLIAYQFNSPVMDHCD